MVLSGLEPFRQLNKALQSAPVKTYRHHAQPCIPHPAGCFTLAFFHTYPCHRGSTLSKNQPPHHPLRLSFSSHRTWNYFGHNQPDSANLPVKCCPEIFGTYDVGRRPSLELIKCLHKCFDLTKTVCLITVSLFSFHC